MCVFHVHRARLAAIGARVGGGPPPLGDPPNDHDHDHDVDVDHDHDHDHDHDLDHDHDHGSWS